MMDDDAASAVEHGTGLDGPLRWVAEGLLFCPADAGHLRARSNQGWVWKNHSLQPGTHYALLYVHFTQYLEGEFISVGFLSRLSRVFSWILGRVASLR